MNVYPKTGKTVCPSALLHEKYDTQSLGGSNLGRTPRLSHIVSSVVSLCSSWSWGAGLKRASGQRPGTWDNQDGSLSQNHHRRHGDLISKEDVIGVIFSTAPRFNPSATGGGEKTKTWAGFSFYAVESRELPPTLERQATVCPSQLKGQVLVLRKENRAKLKH